MKVARIANKYLGIEKTWNLSRRSSDLYYRIMSKTRNQLYDELLFIKCQQGNAKAFDEVVGRWQKCFWQYAYRITGSETAAWDIVQEAWLAIVKGLSKLKDPGVFPGWAFKITHNKCTDWIRRQQRESRLNGQLLERVDSQQSNKNDSGETESLWAVIAKLSPDRRALLNLRYHQNFDLGQIAEILSIQEGTVKSRLHRTVNELRQLME